MPTLKKIFFTILLPGMFLIFCLKLTSAQTFTKTWVHNLEKLKETEQLGLIAETLLKDTFKFKQEDLFFTTYGIKNVSGYSPLIIVNNTNIYQLDVMKSECASNFVNNFLSFKNLKEFDVISIEEAREIYGSAGRNGVINLKVKNHNKLQKCTCNL